MNTLITTERLADFLTLVQGVREVQREFRRTQDSRLRNKLPLLELGLDNAAAQLAADLRAAGDAPAIAAEGGVS